MVMSDNDMQLHTTELHKACEYFSWLSMTTPLAQIIAVLKQLHDTGHTFTHSWELEQLVWGRTEPTRRLRL